MFHHMNRTSLTKAPKRCLIFEKLNDSIDRFPPVELDAGIGHNSADMVSRLTVFNCIFKAAPLRSNNRCSARHGLNLCETKVLVVMQRQINQRISNDVEVTCLCRGFVAEKMYATGIESQLGEESCEHSRDVHGVHAGLSKGKVLELADDYKMEVRQETLENAQHSDLSMQVLFQRDSSRIQQDLIAFLKTQFRLECLSPRLIDRVESRFIK